MRMTIFIKNKRVAIIETPEIIDAKDDNDKDMNAKLIKMAFDEVSKSLKTTDWHFVPEGKDEDIFGDPKKFFDFTNLKDKFQKVRGRYVRL